MKLANDVDIMVFLWNAIEIKNSKALNDRIIICYHGIENLGRFECWVDIVLDSMLSVIIKYTFHPINFLNTFLFIDFGFQNFLVLK